MPGEPTTRERIVALETWRDEHQRQHDRDEQRRERHLDRKYWVIVALVGFFGAVVGGIISRLFVGIP